ncbi:CBS domain-containing protein [Roseiarcus fermentans]|uniref:CBS domain-containing protein n=1 Tax=Roseiarcus fermentans TaxID=1473586 RepID=A0A366FJF0_9HYPH|nr:CBS domain-containing protein [Roseiarcus fermentans]RBP14110.1 CBS domain-containing protein [Roseiarcus fermentans]
MFGSLRNKRRDRPGVLAARLATAEARHPRAPEPTVATALAALRPLALAAVAEDATVGEALRVMAECDAAAVAVTSAAGVAGVFSERDYARNGATGARAAKDAPVAEAMSRTVAEAAPSDTVRRCLDLIAERGVTHAVALDRGRLVGLLSRADLLAAQVAWHERVFHEIEVDQKLLFLRGTYSC